MPNPIPMHSRGSLFAMFNRACRSGVRWLLRGYAVALIALIAFLSYSAIRYLVESLIIPSRTPQQIAGLPRRMDESLIHGSRPDWLGLRSVSNPRSPLDHFHRFDTWIEPDRFNDCTRSGCHSPLPHARQKETRAFLNMHATSIHCAVCHFDEAANPLPLAWYDLITGRATQPPALLRAFGRLTDRDEKSTFSSEDQAAVAALLREAAKAAHDDPALIRAARELEGFRPTGENFANALRDATDVVRRLFRGSYGAKLALSFPGGDPVLGHPNTDAAVREWLANGASATGEQREKMLRAVHPRRRAQTHQCSDCHVEQGGLIQFEKLGYPRSRVFALHNSPVFQMIEHIRQGRPFYLPGFGASHGNEKP
ncbi:MAG: hypothetical protein JNG88_10900 [Phycisphaerales bacterium]|nr:hypothetical protein [Phycisphaerales bacterium]